MLLGKDERLSAGEKQPLARTMSFFGNLNDVTGLPPVAGREFKLVEHIFFESKFRGWLLQRKAELVNQAVRFLFGPGYCGLNQASLEAPAISVDMQMFQQISAVPRRRLYW